MNEDEFQKKVLDGVGTMEKQVKTLREDVIKPIESKVDTLVQNYDQLDKDTKAAFEDLTKIKNNANDVSEALQGIKRVQLQLQRETRMAFGSQDPIQRIVRDPEKRARFNIAIRMAMDKSGDMLRVVKNGYDGDLVKRALSEDSSPGSTIIDDDLLNEIYDTLSTFGVWSSFGVRRMGTKQTKMPVQTARVVANAILTEGGTIADDTNKAGTSVTLEVEVIAALLNVSLQLLEDSEFDVTADLLTDFAEAYANRMDVFALTADGTADATNGGMTGAFEGGTAATAATGNVSMETLDFEDVTNCLLTVDPIVLQRPSRWWMHPRILVRMLHVKDLNGRPIFLTANEAPTPGGIGSILGYPVTLAHAAPSANTTSSKVAVFGDPNANVVGVRRDFMFEASDHHKWNTLQRSFRGWGRAGTKIRRATGLAVLTLAAS